MKTVQKGEEIRRVDNEEGWKLATKGWKLVPKSVWKGKNRPATKKAEKVEEVKVEKVEKVKNKYKTKKESYSKA